MRRRPALLLVLVTLLALAGAEYASPALAAATWLRPVPGRVVRPFRAPLTRYGRGHEGVDLAAAPGTPVRAAGPGIVVFAGAVAGARHVVVRHPNGMRTSYSFLARVGVGRGDHVTRGEILGATGGRGERHDGHVLHLALRIGHTFVDPMQLFAPTDLAIVVHLVAEDSPADHSPAVGAREVPSAEAIAVASGLEEHLTRLYPETHEAALPAWSVAVPVCDALGAPAPGAVGQRPIHPE